MEHGRRRFVISALTLVMAPPVHAQPAPARVAILLTGSSAMAAPEYTAFTQQLRDLGWTDGKNLVLDQRWAEAPEAFSALAADAIRARPSVILAAGPDATRAARRATSAIPIVMIGSSDPRAVGVGSLARPGGNLTGVTIGQPEVTTAKRLQLLKETLPALTRVAVVWDVKRTPDGGAGSTTLTAAARDLGVRLRDFDIRSVADFSSTFAAAKRDGEEAVLLIESPRAVANRAVIAELGLRHRLPLMTQFSRIVDAGGLMAYGPDLSDLFRRAATYVDKILKGTQPAELPVQQPLKYQFVINLKTAKALGLTIPPSLLARADQVLE